MSKTWRMSKASALVVAMLILAVMATPAPVDAAQTDVSILDDVFLPASVTINAGDTVKWTNQGLNPHTVTADDGSFGSSTLNNGQTFTQAFSGPGRTVPYYCQIHGAPGGVGMSGVVVVEENVASRAPADFDGNGSTDISVFRPSSGAWFVHNGDTTIYGTTGDIPVPGNYLGNAATDVAVFRPSTGTWFVEGGSTVAWGTDGDIPVPGDYDGNGATDMAVFRPSTGTWFVQGGSTVAWGTDGDIPVPGDYDGNATTDMAVFRPSTGTWFVRSGSTVNFGTTGDIPQPGDYDANGTIDFAVFRPSSSVWFIQGGSTLAWGTGGDIPLPLPSAIQRFFV